VSEARVEDLFSKRQEIANQTSIAQRVLAAVLDASSHWTAVQLDKDGASTSDAPSSSSSAAPTDGGAKAAKPAGGKRRRKGWFS